MAQDSKANEFKLHTTRKAKDGTYLHVMDTKSKTKRVRAEKPGDNQINEVLITVDEKVKVKVYVKNAYNTGLVAYAGTKTENYKKKDKEGNVKQLERKVHQYDTRQFTYLQGTDGNLYLVIGMGTKAKGTLSEGWADLSAYARNLVAPVKVLELNNPIKATFAIDEDASSFFPVQVDGQGIKHTSDKAIEGYKLSLLGIVSFDEEAITNLPEAPAKEVVATEIEDDEF